MKKLLIFLTEMSLDQKKYLGLALIVIILLLVYSVSRISEKPTLSIEQSGASEFKNGNLVVDETSEFYRNRNSRIQNQNELIIQRMKEVDERLSEFARRFDDKVASNNGKTPDTQVTPGDSPPSTPVPQQEVAGKKMNRRG